MTHDLVIRGATVVDGTGRPGYTADVAVAGRVITEVGRVSGRAASEIDADGLVVTPGFVDVHTHYDGQVTWDPLLTPSFWHGVTTAVLGNCGVGFAPVRPDRRDFLVQLMEGVEDIPGTALHEGIRWEWETFPEYLDALDRMPRALDIGTHVPHGAVRAYVMDERGAANETPTADDLARIAEIVEASIRAGALGFSTNRLPMHTSRDGRPVPGTFADEVELDAIGRAVAAGGGGVIEVVTSDAMGTVPGGWRADVDWATRMSLETGLAVTLCLSQVDTQPDHWRDVLGWIHEARDAGANLVPQVAGRPLGLLLGLTTKHQFQGRPSYDEIAHLPVEARARALAEPERRARILAEAGPSKGLAVYATRLAAKAFPLGDVPDYGPRPEASIATVAEATGRTVDEVYYDLYLENGGRRLVLFALGGYAYRNSDHIREMLADPSTVLGLADGGAHVALICDASAYTSMLSYWVRDRTRGERLPLELAVSKMTGAPARLYGLDDRGVITPGKKADLNVVDLERLQLRAPEVVADLPTGASRVIQRADGYVATIVSGEVIARDGEDTGARPGRLVPARLASLSDRARDVLAAAPRPPADPALFSSNTLFGEPGIYPAGPPMVPAAGPAVDRDAARRALADVGVGDTVAARLDDAELVGRAPDAGVRAGLLALTGTVAEPLLDAFLRGDATVDHLAYGATASPGRVVGPAAGGAPRDRAVNERYRAEHPALLALSLTHDLLWRGAGASQCEEATLHALGAMVHVQLLARCPELARTGTELARRQNSLAITLLNSRQPGSADISLIAPDGSGTIPGGAPSMQTRDFWSIPFVGDGPHDGDAPALLGAVLARVLEPGAAPARPPRYDDALGALLSDRLGRDWLPLDDQWRAAAALGLVEGP